MAEPLLQDLPRDLPTLLRRFGTDTRCRAYLVRARWPEGFCCGGCGHDRACSHRKRLIEACRACGKRHSILAGGLFEQTRPFFRPARRDRGTGSPSGSSRSSW